MSEMTKGTLVLTPGLQAATYVAYRPDLGGHVVAMIGEDDTTPGEQFVVESVTPLRRPDPAALRYVRASGRCPCECNSGGFCGGCGHAGCGRR